MLILPIKKKWFDMILSGEKKEEYREIKPYWVARLVKNGYPNTVILRNGYRKDSPQITCECRLSIGQGKPEWGAEKRKRVLHIRNIRSIGGVIMTKLDCFAYNKEKNECKALVKLVCENKKCRFYKTSAQIREERIKGN